ncbi:tail tube terminator protein [Microcystis phage vB_MweS-yong2]|nr:tail tube terminator protein [Microcystis phage vB_MweS-yong2]
MSLSHTALRLAVVEALAPHACFEGGNARWPTAARGRVMDSMIAPVAGTEEDARSPLIAVYVDDAKREGYGSAPDAQIEGRLEVTLVFEVVVPVVRQQKDGQTVLDAPGDSDPLAEGLLDLLCEQIDQTLGDARLWPPLSLALFAMGPQESRPWTDADAGLRLSARRLEYPCHVPRTARFPTSGAGLALLPDPLRSVALALPPPSDGRAICEAMAAGLGPAADLGQPLTELRLSLRFDRSEGSTAPAEADFQPKVTP